MTPVEKQKIIDEFGELDWKVAAHKPVAARHKALRDTIAAWFADRPEEQIHIVGEKYQVDVSPCATETKITRMRALYRHLGVQRFLELCSFPIGRLAMVVSDPSAFVEKSQTGARKVSSLPREAAS